MIPFSAISAFSAFLSTMNGIVFALCNTPFSVPPFLRAAAPQRSTQGR